MAATVFRFKVVYLSMRSCKRTKYTSTCYQVAIFRKYCQINTNYEALVTER